MASSKKPPNLRETKACADCKYYNGHGLCTMYDYPVDDDDLCDSFVKAPQSEAKDRLWKAHRNRLERNH